jgi:putative tryptophan/tyrosine transport system substrate-binding protein
VRRRDFIALIGGAAAWPRTSWAQQADRVHRVGILMPYPKDDPEYDTRVRAFRQELEKLGWMDGRNIQFDERWTGDNMDLIRANSTSLMASNPDVVLATGGRVVPILMQLSRSIPIVLPGSSDPVAVGWVTSLAQPGGNITGFTLFDISIIGKCLEILKEIAPGIVRVALIYNPDNPNSLFYRRAFEAASGPLTVEAMSLPIHGLADIERAIASAADRQNAGILFPPDITTAALRDEVVALVARRHLPAIYSDNVFVKSGGLVSYGPDRIDLFRRSASYVDRILRGEKVSGMPLQQPTNLEDELTHGAGRVDVLLIKVEIDASVLEVLVGPQV